MKETDQRQSDSKEIVPYYGPHETRNFVAAAQCLRIILVDETPAGNQISCGQQMLTNSGETEALLDRYLM